MKEESGSVPLTIGSGRGPKTYGSGSETLPQGLAMCQLKNVNNFPFSIVFHEVCLNPTEKNGVP
jgi:hypothetical protein